jgi:histidinol-phosphatase (PHP family)
VIVDYHVHSPYCGHAQGKTIEYIENAIKNGVDEIGFSDHLGRYYLSKSQKKRYWDWGMEERDIARYFSEILDLKESFEDDIRIKIGLEVDYIEGAEQLLEGIVSRYPFDYLLGSVHCLPKLGWNHITQYVKVQPEKVYELYFDAVAGALKSQMFQSLAHIDFIWRYIEWPDVTSEIMSEYISNAVALSVKNNVCMEINSNGYLWSVLNDDRTYDLFAILLNAIKIHKANITLGSDAHTPEFVAKAFPKIISRLLRDGLGQVSVFDARQQKNVMLG